MVSGLGEGAVWLMQSQLLGIQTSSVNIQMEDENSTWKILGDAKSDVINSSLPLVFKEEISENQDEDENKSQENVNEGSIEEMMVKDFFLPIYKISPAEIFSNEIPALDINFINPNIDTTNLQDNDGSQIYNSAEVLGPQIAKWYVALRNFVLIGLMIVLLYIGIRILISSTSGDKAKYKEHIKDWLVAVILVIFMHYIMAFALTITEYIVEALSTTNQGIEFTVSEENIQAMEEQAEVDLPGDTYYTNLMGLVRLEQQASTKDENGSDVFTWNYIGYTFVYLVLVMFTIMFLVIYIKRVVYMAFLTVIAPLVALTYPIDKISDGQAQAFSMWLKDYIYNLLLQPFHLLLYTMLVGSVMDLASSNVFYAIVALAFLMPAEQLLRRLFGFEKSDTAGSIMSGVVGGSMLMNAINGIGKIGSIPKKIGGGNGDSSGSGNNGKTRLVARKPDADKKKSMEDLLKDDNNGNDNSSDNGTVRLTDNQGTENNNGQSNNSDNSNIRLVGRGRGQSTGVLNSTNSSQNEENQTEETNNENDNSDSKAEKPKIIRAVAGTAGHYTAKVAKKVPRLLTKGAMAASMGTIGVAAGLATGDLSNAGKYGLAAAGVGAKVGDGVSNVASNITTGAPNVARGIRDNFEQRAFTKQQREAMQNARADREWEKSKDIQKKYKDEFGKDYKKAMETAKQFRQYGVTNDEATIKRIKDIGVGNAPTKEDIATTKAASSVQTEDDLKALSDRLRSNDISEEKIKRMENDVRKYNISGNFT